MLGELGVLYKDVQKSIPPSPCSFAQTRHKTVVERLKKEHKRSRHAVYAYVTAGKEKFNDDGEPCGTAGLPVLNAIKRRELDNIIVVVVRYFGGILLGKGGLMRAYGKAAGRELDRMIGDKNANLS